MQNPTPPQPKFKGILFDLDGTLVDTAPDMVASLNAILAQQNQAPLSFQHIRPWVSHGGAALINLAFANESEQKKEQLRQDFLSHYQNNLVNHSALFNGMAEVLQWIQQHDLQWGIVTNKPSWLAEPLLKQLHFPKPYCTLICGDTLSENKPHPLPLLTACKQMGLSTAQCIYIGDAKRDIEAAQNANMVSVIANYGYIEKDDNIQNWQADYTINHAKQLIAILT